ncbi:MAG: polysaccharide deacetylase family protein [Rikenellaceae bacterium]|nr:polysaccharide deacetylase family protein [Rikenellaceae bacterium]
MAWVIVILLLGVLAALVWASADIGSGVYLKALCRAESADKVVALTFDDGPDADSTPRVLDLLKRHGVRATFFVVGEQARQNPELIHRMVAEGHTVAGHSYYHLPQSTLWSSQRYTEEVFRCNDVVARLTGLRMRLYRPPFGVTNPPIARAVKNLGLIPVGWSVRSLDTVTKNSDRVVDRVMRGLRGGDVILLHDRLENSEELLEKLLTALQAQSYTTATVDELFKIEAYEK